MEAHAKAKRLPFPASSPSNKTAKSFLPSPSPTATSNLLSPYYHHHHHTPQPSSDPLSCFPCRAGMQTSEVVAQPQRNAAKPPAILLMTTPTPTPTSSTDHSTADLVVDTHHQPLAAVVKRKQRTKRPRHHRDPPAAASSSASSSESTTTEEEDMAHCLILLAQGAAGGAPHASVVDSKPSPSPSPSMSSSPQHHQNQQAPQPPVPTGPAPPRAERYTSRKYTEAAATADGVRAGFYVYECKTCNKCFPTFQALGGHRASHKKPRLADDVAAAAALPVNVVTTTTTTETKKQHKPPTTAPSPSPPPPLPALPLQLHPPHLQTIDIAAAFPDVTTALSLNSVAAAAAVRSGGAKLRVHECSICGAEFASGQALGGHMRRHRPLNAPDRAVTTAIAAGITSNSKSKEEASVGINLELDLNLPAPSDEEAAVSLIPPPPPPAVMLGLGQFSDGKKAGLMLTASALVDCHY